MNICIKMWMKTCFHSHFYTIFFLGFMKGNWSSWFPISMVFNQFKIALQYVLLDCIKFSQFWWSKCFFPQINRPLALTTERYENPCCRKTDQNQKLNEKVISQSESQNSKTSNKPMEPPLSNKIPDFIANCTDFFFQDWLYSTQE